MSILISSSLLRSGDYDSPRSSVTGEKDSRLQRVLDFWLCIPIQCRPYHE